jgi:2OG-Fe(II) oxygenase superfamily
MIPDMTKIAGGCVAHGEFPSLGEPVKGLNFWVSPAGRPEQLYIQDLLDTSACDELIRYYEQQGSYAPVSVQGTALEDDRVGSRRITCWDEAFADALWVRLKNYLPGEFYFHHYSPTDWWQHGQHRTWKPVGVTPMARFMRYEEGGQHYTHYDAGYIPSDKPVEVGDRRTLFSGVLYLTTNSTGATRFIADGQGNLPIWERDLADWTRETTEAEVIQEVLPRTGSVLLFQHRLAHNVSQYDGKEGPRIIIRFDVEFEAI